MKKLLFIILTIGVVTSSRGQIINLAQCHNPTNKRISYIVDYLQVDSQFVHSVGFKKGDIKKLEVKDTTLIITTKLLIVFNGKPLVCRKVKEANLAGVDKDNVISIVKLDQEAAKRSYGKKGRKGALIITVSSP